MAIFDTIQENTYGIVSRYFGDDATWRPVGSPSALFTGMILLREPTAEAELGTVTYTPETAIMEYYPTVFPSLKESVDNGETETVTIKGIDYYVRAVTAKFDGKALIAVLQIKKTGT